MNIRLQEDNELKGLYHEMECRFNVNKYSGSGLFSKMERLLKIRELLHAASIVDSKIREGRSYWKIF
jgi:hypothetical protein